MFIFRVVLICLVFCQTSCSQENTRPLLLLNPTVYTGDSTVYENAALAFKNSNIVLLADARLIRLDMSAYELVEAFGLFVYPAALVRALPEHDEEHAYYIRLDEDTYLLVSTQTDTTLEVPVLQEGGEATFVVTSEAIDNNEPAIRYLVVKGRLKRENNVTLRPLVEEQ